MSEFETQWSGLRPSSGKGHAVSRRVLLVSSTLALASLRSSIARAGEVPVHVLTPEMFGARGDGVTNDTAAFVRLSHAVARRGGGHIVLRPTTYVVGEQASPGRKAAAYAFEPSPILSFVGLNGPIILEGNGATLRCAPGLRFGTFDPVTGKPLEHGANYYDRGHLATPYEQMIRVERCTGAVEIRDLELDGNLAHHKVGGGFGDTGHQIPCSGILLLSNSGNEIIRNVHAHHHALDGLTITDRDDLDGVVRRAELVRCEYNGRQGCSITAGSKWHFVRCRFAHTGRAGISSAPGAGVDIEAEGLRNVGHSFDECEFVDNAGCGMVADSGDTEGATFTRCRFIGTTNWSAWPRKPFFSFTGCSFIGSIVSCFGDPDPARATQFHDCLFTDEPALSPTRKVYRAGKPHGPLADLSSEENVRFERCRFMAVAGAVLPWSTSAIFKDCRMRQTIRQPCYPRGTYLGTNWIDCPTVGLDGSHVRGTLMLNGQRVLGMK